MLNLQFRDNISVIRSKDIKETANILLLLKEKLNKFDESSNCTKHIEYSSSISVSKKQNVTKDIVFIKQLSCIHGISEKIAKDISSVYPSLKTLILTYNDLSVSDAEKLLTQINGIGNILSKKIYYHLF